LKRLATLVGAATLAVAAALPAITSAQTVPVRGPGVCAAAFDPYRVPMAKLRSCEMRTFPRRAVKRLPDGGRAYVYDAAGLKTTYFVPPRGFDPLRANRRQLARYGLPAPSEVSGARSRWANLVRGSRAVTPPPYLVEGKARMSMNFYNWSGYTTKPASLNGAYRQVTGRWVEPRFYHSVCSRNSFGVWAGLGGWSPGPGAPLAQAGTAHGVGGMKSHQGWSEVLPKQRSVVVQPIMASAGRLFQVHVRRIRGGFHFTMYNLRTRRSLSFNVASGKYNGHTAEMIAERPLVGGNYTNLSNFRTLTVKSVLVNGKSRLHRIGNYRHEKIVMHSSSRMLAEPDDLYNYGRSFQIFQRHCR
jgi:hypothetical protein